MIRIGENKDIEQGVQLIQKYIKEFNFGKNIEDNTEYYSGLCDAMIQDKTVIVSEDNNEINGCLLGYRIPNLLNPKNVQLHILVTWVREDKRGSSIFYRMNKFLEQNIIKQGEEVIYYSLPTTKINHNKLGYREFQKMFIKEN